jgi:hypothetical protein
MTIFPLMMLIYSKCNEFRNSNLFFLENEKIRIFCKKTRTNSEQIGNESFQNDIVSLVKIEIYSNSIFWGK